MNRIFARCALPLFALALIATLPAPAQAQSSITVRVRSLESTAPFGNDSLVTVLIIQNYGAGLVVGSRDLVGATAPNAQNEYTVSVPLTPSYESNRSYRIEAYVGRNSSRISKYYGYADVTLNQSNTNIQITTANQQRPIPEVSSGLAALAGGLLLLAVAAGLLIWRQLRLRPLPRRLA